MNNTELIDRVRGRLLSWRAAELISFNGYSADELCRLFGVSNTYHIPWSDLQALNSVHGLTIYKMHLARLK